MELTEAKSSDEVKESFQTLTHYAGFDWAMEEHQVAVIDHDGNVLLNLRFCNDAVGWADLRAKIAVYPNLGVAIETSCGPAVERLLELGLTISFQKQGREDATL